MAPATKCECGANLWTRQQFPPLRLVPPDPAVFMLATFADGSRCALTAADYCALTGEQLAAIREWTFLSTDRAPLSAQGE
jgi:hypothetical protein